MSVTPHKRLTPTTIGVKSVPTSKLIPNPHNPRMLFDKAPLAILEASIKKVGILVPLTVYWNDSKNSFVILDGQRRWICAQKANLKEVPVNQVAEPTLVQNIVTMFQIHKLREDWELMPTALKLELLMSELNEVNEKKLAALTGLDQSVVSRCKKLLSFSKKYQDMMLDPNPDKRVKADFFIELYSVSNDRFVVKQDWYTKDHFVKKMLEKYQSDNKTIKSVTDFRIIKQYINNACKAGKEKTISKKLHEFSENIDYPINYLEINEANITANTRSLIKKLDHLERALEDIDVNEYYGEEDLWVNLERLMMLIKAKLREAGRRTKE